MNRSTTALRRRIRPAPRGMTLIEIMIVLVILGMIAGAIGVNVVGSKKKADIKFAKKEVLTLVNDVERYRIDKNKLPDSLKELETEKFITRLSKDPWGQEYQLVVTGEDFEIVSYGPNKSQGGGDDISSTQRD